MKQYINLLEGIGFSKLSAELYIHLIENGKMSISQLVEKSGIHRTQIYRILPLLIEQGIILVHIVGKSKTYSAASPLKIYEIYEEQNKNREILISELEDKYNNKSDKISVTHNVGIKGIRASYDDILYTLNKGDVFYRITSELDVDKVNNVYLPRYYKTKRDEKEIERYIIMSDKTHKQKQPKLEREVKIVNDKELDDNVIFTIYGDKVSLLDLNSDSSIIIENKAIANFQKKIFKLLFKKL